MNQVDTTLVLEAREGSHEAIDRLFAQCGDRLLTYIRLRLGPSLRGRLESRDILQATLMKAFTSFKNLDAENSRSLMAWLARITDNQIRDQAAFYGRERRAAARELPIESAPPTALAHRVRSQVSQLMLDESLERVDEALDELEPDHREVILLRYFHEMSFKEIAHTMGRTPDACRMLLARAMATLTLQVKGDS